MVSKTRKAEAAMASGVNWKKVREVAERTDVPDRTLRYWCRRGWVVHVKLHGWGIRIPETEIERLLADRRGPAEEVAKQLAF